MCDIERQTYRNMSPPQICAQVSHYTNLSLTINVDVPVGVIYTNKVWEFADVELHVGVQANESVFCLIEYGDILMLI